MKIAITGGIGAGKSTIIQKFKDANYPNVKFYSMDKFVDELYKEKDWLDWLKERFGTVDRKELSNRAFACDSVRATLNSQSALKIGYMLGTALADSENHVVIEFPLLFETQMQNVFTHTVLVTADTPTRIERVVARGKKTAEEAAKVIAAQMPEQKKKSMSGIVIDTTSTSIEDCYNQLIKDLGFV